MSAAEKGCRFMKTYPCEVQGTAHKEARFMKKFLAVVLAAALALSLVACGGAPASSGASSAGSEGGSTPASTQSYDYKIGVVTPSGDHGFTGESVAQANLMAEEMMEKYPGMDITVRDGIDAAAQIEAIENLLAGGDMDMIILWPMEGEALRSAAQSIVDAGVKLVVYDRLIEGFTADTFVGDIMGDNVGIGKAMGEYLNEFYADDDDVQYLRFVGDSSTVTSQRSEGMDGVLGDNFNQVAETLVTNWSTEEAQGQMEDWLNAHSVEEIEALDLIVTHDDEIVDGIMNALDAYSGEATINVKLITSVGGREETMQKFESTQLGVKFWTSFFSPSFIRDAFELGIGDLIGEPYTAEQDENGTYLIPSFSITNADLAGDEDFESYRASDTYTTRYAINE